MVATEYFRLFRYEYMAPLMAPEPAPSSSSFSSTAHSRRQRQQQSHAQLDFLKASMAPEVTDGNVCGAEALLKNWELLSLYCSDVHVQLKRLEQVAADSLLASTTTSVTITENTLRHLYPHLVSNDEDSRSLAGRLLNQRLVLQGLVRFAWDEACGCVVRLESKVDMLTPMLKLLGTSEDVATVFSKALISLEGRLTVERP